jgi:hypothetical protein
MSELYKRPETLNLLTDEQLQELKARDIAADKHENETRDSWVVFDSRTRKWHTKMQDAKYAWQSLQQVSAEQLYEIIYWLSIPDEPYNSKGCGRPGKIKELARDIKYCMSSKQRAVAYKIITNRFNILGENKNA